MPIQLTFLTFYRLQFQVLRLSTMVYQNALSRVEQTQLIQLLATQTPIRTIANILRRPLSSIYRLRAKLLETGNLDRREGSGRRPILSNRMKTLVRRQVRINRRTTLDDIKEELGIVNVSLKTISLALRETGEFKNGLLKKKPFIKGYEDWNGVVIIRTGHWNNGAQFYFQMNLDSRYDSIEEPGSGSLLEKSTIQLTIVLELLSTTRK